jgi:hypothetical protein
VLSQHFFNLVVEILGVLVVFNLDGSNLEGVHDGIEQTEKAARANNDK